MLSKMKTDRIYKLMGRIEKAAINWLGGPECKTRSELCPANRESVLDSSPEGISPTGLPWDTVLVIDVSTSMSWRDCDPSRLAAAKKAGETFINKRATLSPHDRIAIVSFNIQGQVVLPLTRLTAMQKVVMSLEKLTPGGGTDLMAGVETAWNLYQPELFNDTCQSSLRRILLLTDGQGGNPIRLAKSVKSHGILIEAIGFAGRRSEVNECLLKKVATTDPGGFTHYWFFRDTQSLVRHYENLASGLLFKG
jgi:hypothetical protein